jgi:twinkle protein
LITPEEFARKHFRDYRQKGAELVPVYCPFCHGGKSGDKFTFALNMENLTYNCKRGNCNETGTFTKLLKHFGEQAPNFEIKRLATKTYKAPQTKVSEFSEKVEQYLKLRGIGLDVCRKYQVGESGGNIAFPYHDDKGNLVLMKFRKPEKYTGKGQKAWREEGGKAIFWGMNLCRPDKPLVITEGEFDTLSLTECGIVNVVSVPSGAEDMSCIDNCWDWLQQFKKIIIWPDNDEPGQEMCRKLINKLGNWRCAVVESVYKDANECLFKAGHDGVLEEFGNAKNVPIVGLISLADVKAFDYDGLTRIKSSVKLLNKHTAGYIGGQLSVWTGDSGSGKSTFVGQELLEAIEHGYAVCAYSGELPAPVFRYWIDLQAAGQNNLSYKDDVLRGEKVPYLKSDIADNIRKWYASKFYLCDNYSEATDTTILELFQYAAMRYDCKVFLIDNLMSMTLDGPDSDYYRQQSLFLQQAKQFSRKHDVHVHVVAHPRKSGGRSTKDDVAGSKNITDWADNVFGVYRVKEEDTDPIYKNFNTVIDVLKCRFTGVVGKPIGLFFEGDSKRFSTESESRDSYKYGWETHREPPAVMAGGKMWGN